MHRHRLFISLIIGPLLGCGHEDGHLFFPEFDYPSVTVSRAGMARLRLVNEWGDRDEGLVIGRISGIGANEDGKLAIFDQVDCRIWILDTGTGETAKWGGCGDGPGEFRSITAGAFSGDTLIVADSERSAIVWLSKNGTEIKRSHLRIREMGAMAISDIHVENQGLIIAGLDLMPNSFGFEKHHQVVSLSETGSEVVGRGLLVPPIAQRTPRATIRDGSVCAGRLGGSEEVLLAVNTWGPQVVLLGLPDFDPLFSRRVPIWWAEAVENVDRPGDWAPFGPIPQAACGKSHAIIGYRLQGRGDSGGVEVFEAALVIFGYSDGKLNMLGGAEPPGEDSVLRMTPGAAIGDRFFFFSNGFSGYPIVREYILEVASP